MLIYPAIDLFEGKAVRLFKGDYSQMTIYNENPLEVAKDFVRSGATHIHLVDLEGAKSGTTPNIDTVCMIKQNTNLFCEIGGGIRDINVIDRYIMAGVDRVILGTAAVTEQGFVEKAVNKYGEKIAVGIDIKDGFVAIKGWTETSNINAFDFCEKMQSLGVSALICGLGNGHFFPAVQNMFINMCSKDERGTANSTLFVSWDIGAGIGTLLGGVLAEAFGFGPAFWCAALVNLAGAGLFLLYGCGAYLRNKA